MNPFVLAARGICQCVGRGPFVQGESVGVMAEGILCESLCARGICQCDGRGYCM